MAPMQVIQNPLFYRSLFQDLGLEILFLTIVLTLSITIYWVTRESYHITHHMGIKYFRNAFLFFGVAYLFRFFFYLLSYIYNYDLISYLDLSPRMLGGGSILVYTFMSSIALISLLYALSYTKLKRVELPEYLIYIAGLLISIASFFVFAIFWVVHSLLSFMIIFLVLLQKNKSRAHTLGFAYISLAIFWIVSIVGDLFYFSALNSFRPILYSLLTIILLFISFRTIRRVG